MSYVLVADADVDRTASCLELLSSLGAAARMARTAEDAVALVRGQGSPLLLIVDLALPGGGFAVVDALPGNRRDHPSIVAWTSDEGMREYARQHLAGADAHILRGAVRFGVLQSVLQRLLRRPLPADAVDEPLAAPIGAEAAMTELSGKARQLSATAGVAVYLRTPGETKFRASVSWTSDSPIPNVPAWMPQVFGSVLETSRPMILPDLSLDPAGSVSSLASHDGIGGIVAVPVAAASGEVAGMICLFDIKPLVISAAQIETLRALGGMPRPGPMPVPVRAVLTVMIVQLSVATPSRDCAVEVGRTWPGTCTGATAGEAVAGVAATAGDGPGAAPVGDDGCEKAATQRPRGTPVTA